MNADAFRYDGKRALVVGGATGMGAATARLVTDLGVGHGAVAADRGVAVDEPTIDLGVVSATRDEHDELRRLANHVDGPGAATEFELLPVVAVEDQPVAVGLGDIFCEHLQGHAQRFLVPGADALVAIVGAKHVHMVDEVFRAVHHGVQRADQQCWFAQAFDESDETVRVQRIHLDALGQTLVLLDKHPQHRLRLVLTNEQVCREVLGLPPLVECGGKRTEFKEQVTQEGALALSESHASHPNGDAMQVVLQGRVPQLRPWDRN